MNHFIQEVIQEYSWLFISGILLLLFQNTIKEAVDGIMIFLGNDYNEDDVVEVDGSPGRIVRVGIWKTVFFIYHVIDGRIVGGSKLVVTNSKLKDLKIEKPLPNLDLSKYTPK
jgi:small-conductance mechanosensitive channel